MTSPKRKSFALQLAAVKRVVGSLVLITGLSITIGSMVAFFLWSLQEMIHFRFEHPWLLYLLPVAGVAIHFIYKTYGKPAEKGNSLILEQIELEGGPVPKRMAPLILLTTLMTHLVGGSAGREGTAVQMGGSMASMFNGLLKLGEADRKMLLSAGIAAGFGAVFGTPFTGAIFAFEVLTKGKLQFRGLLPALLAALLADATVDAWQVHHQHYRIDELPISAAYFNGTLHFDFLLALKIVPAAAAFGLVSYLFTRMTSEIKRRSNDIFKSKWMIPFVGGIVIIALTQLLDKPDYLSLGVDPEYPAAVTLQSAFHLGGADNFSWFWKTIYTAVTIGTGFKGGEVTPLFYIGATLGNTLSAMLNAPVSLFAALGFIAVFAGATNTPLACTIMGAELFGTEHLIFFALACFIAYLFSGHAGIYGPMEPGRKSHYLREKLERYRFHLRAQP